MKTKASIDALSSLNPATVQLMTRYTQEFQSITESPQPTGPWKDWDCPSSLPEVMYCSSSARKGDMMLP